MTVTKIGQVLRAASVGVPSSRLTAMPALRRPMNRMKKPIPTAIAVLRV